MSFSIQLSRTLSPLGGRAGDGFGDGTRGARVGARGGGAEHHRITRSVREDEYGPVVMGVRPDGVFGRIWPESGPAIPPPTAPAGRSSTPSWAWRGGDPAGGSREARGRSVRSSLPTTTRPTTRPSTAPTTSPPAATTSTTTATTTTTTVRSTTEDRWAWGPTRGYSVRPHSYWTPLPTTTEETTSSSPDPTTTYPSCPDSSSCSTLRSKVRRVTIILIVLECYNVLLVLLLVFLLVRQYRRKNQVLVVTHFLREGEAEPPTSARTNGLFSRNKQPQHSSSTERGSVYLPMMPLQLETV